jgi:hypothetical protein
VSKAQNISVLENNAELERFEFETDREIAEKTKGEYRLHRNKVTYPKKKPGYKQIVYYMRHTRTGKYHPDTSTKKVVLVPLTEKELSNVR